MKDIIVLNGPPGCGKDAIASRICTLLPEVQHHEVKYRLIQLALAISGLTLEGWLQLNRRELKEIPAASLGGLTPRQFLIRISEEYIKPLYGPQYFGMQAAKRVAVSSAQNFIFSDGGFDAEVQCLSSVGNVHLVHIHREECTFLGDSRSYLSADAPYLSTYLQVHQVEGNLDVAVAAIAAHMYEWVSK